MRTRAPIVSLPAIAALVLLLGRSRATAAVFPECDGVSFPQSIQARGQTLTLNGLGLRKATIFGINVYVGALYLPHPTADANAILTAREPAEMQLRFVFHVSAAQLRGAWKEGFEKSAPGQLPRLQSRIAPLDS